jgi:nicotinic acid mononucleotide adenylyltransferase
VSYQPERIRDAGVPLFVMATGGGAGIQQMLWETPGIGAVLVGAQFPYAKEETNEFIGFKPDRYVSEETAIAQASAAYMRAKAVSGMRPAIGLGLTAAVATTTPPRGGYRVHAAVVSDLGCKAASATLRPDAVRRHHGVLCDYMGMDLISELVEPESTMLADGDYDAHNLQFDRDVSYKVGEMLWRRPVFMPNGERRLVLPKPSWQYVHFPGSFNPPHAGHHHMAAVTERQQNLPLVYSINADHPDKGLLAPIDLLARAAYFRAARFENPRPLVFTRDQGLFTDKARAIGRNARIVLGADTLVRLTDPKWGMSVEAMLDIHLENQTRFYLFNRDGVRVVPFIQSLPNWQRYRKLFVGLGDAPNISSTELRAAAAL